MTALDHLTNEELRPYLKGSLIDIARFVSITAARKMVSTFGGCPVSIPTTHTNTRHRLYTLLGEGDFKKMVDLYRGEEIEIPICKALQSRLRAIQMKQDRKAGLSVPEIARKHQVTTRCARRYINYEQQPIKN